MAEECGGNWAIDRQVETEGGVAKLIPEQRRKT